MGTPASDDEAVTRLSVELEGLRISITRSRGATASSVRTSEGSRASPAPVQAGAASPVQDDFGFTLVDEVGVVPNPPTLRPMGSPEPRSSIEASFPAIPRTLLDSARNLRSAVATPEDRARRAWLAGCWAGAVLAGRCATPNCTAPLALPSRVYVILRTATSNDVRVTHSRASYFQLVDNLRSSATLSHGFPTETEARIYVAGAGRAFPSSSSR